MGIAYADKGATLTDIVTVEDAEGLLEWLQSHPHGALDLAECSHLHAANLQVMMAARPTIASWPRDAAFADWLRHALQPLQGK